MINLSTLKKMLIWYRECKKYNQMSERQKRSFSNPSQIHYFGGKIYRGINICTLGLSIANIYLLKDEGYLCEPKKNYFELSAYGEECLENYLAGDTQAIPVGKVASPKHPEDESYYSFDLGQMINRDKY